MINTLIICSLLNANCGKNLKIGDCKMLSRACEVASECERRDHISWGLYTCLKAAIPKCDDVCGYRGDEFWQKILSPNGAFSVYRSDRKNLKRP